MFRSRGATVSTSELRSLEPENRTAYVARRDEQQRMLDKIILARVESHVFTTPYRPTQAARSPPCASGVATVSPDGAFSVETLLEHYLSIAESIAGVR